MQICTYGTLEYAVAENIPVPHGFTTRLGGVSRDNLFSMNISLHRGEPRENVLENYRILSRAIGFDPAGMVLTNQTHTDRIFCVGREQWGTGITLPSLDECDALITNHPGTTLTVFTADCTPILLWDSVTGAVGAVHAGWRGTAADIAGKTIRAMVEHFGSRPENIRGAIGPNIGPCCFETDMDVPQALEAQYGAHVWDYITKKGEKFFPNLKKINALSLERAGVFNIDLSCECTVCAPDRYWSARVHGKTRGSQGALITCREANV